MKSLIIGNANSILDGGGINYTLGLANALIELGFEVDYSPGYITDMKSEKNVLPMMNPAINIIYDDYLSGKSITKRVYRSIVNKLKYKHVFIQSLNIPDFILNNNGYILCDFPSNKQLTKGDITKLKTYKRVIANSLFTAKWVAEYWNVEAVVLYPPIQPIKVVEKKEAIITTVGRFAFGNRSKNHLELIDAFIKLYESGVHHWEFHLAGFVQDIEYLNQLKEKATGYPIVFHPNINRENLEKLYAKSSIYWHACGVNIDAQKTPRLLEHFGISTVEAMTAGCVPIVINKGGQPEVVGDIGYTWNTIEECYTKTASLIQQPEKIIELSEAAKKQSIKFQFDAFKSSLKELIYRS